jgi:hypothetical protein
LSGMSAMADLALPGESDLEPELDRREQIVA